MPDSVVIEHLEILHAIFHLYQMRGCHYQRSSSVSQPCRLSVYCEAVTEIIRQECFFIEKYPFLPEIGDNVTNFMHAVIPIPSMKIEFNIPFLPVQNTKDRSPVFIGKLCNPVHDKPGAEFAQSGIRAVNREERLWGNKLFWIVLPTSAHR